MIIEEILKCSIIMVTNFKEWLIDLDQRIKSRITADMLEFEKYRAVEIEGILKERVKYAFFQGVWEDDAFDLCVEKAYELGDVRQGIYLLRESASIAEDHSSRKITLEHSQKAIQKLDEFSVKKSTDLGEDSKLILDIIKKESEAKIGDIYKIYREKGGVHTSKTLQRKVEKLEKAKFITTKKTGGGVHGNTTIVSFKKNKSLSEF
jgi:archaeal cell division control protein 6